MGILDLFDQCRMQMKEEISLPPQFIFSTIIQVRSSDVNYGGHLGNDSVLTLMQGARLLFYQSLGFKNEISFADSIGQIITQVAVQYKAESFIGDRLVFSLGIETIHKYGFDMVYHIVHEVTGKEIARGKTHNLCFDYQKRRLAPIPSILLEKLHEALQK